MIKIQNSTQSFFGHLDLKIGIYLGFGISQLEFVIANQARFPGKPGVRLPRLKIDLDGVGIQNPPVDFLLAR